MKLWRPRFSSELLYFVTTSVQSHRKYLQYPAAKQILLDLFDCYRRNGQVYLYSFVIMPTHIHILIRIPEPSTLSNFLRDFKSLSSNRIRRFYQAVHPEIKIPKNKIWEDGFVAKEVYSFPFLEQKVKYIHENPCKSPCNLADLPEQYPWSSAMYYLSKRSCIIPIDDYRDYFLD